MREANRAACARAAVTTTNMRSHIIAQKTLRLVRDQGRVPRARTLQLHGIDGDLVASDAIARSRASPRSRGAAARREVTS